MEIDRNASRESAYATLVHELAHLYCGHLGSPNEKWWPNRFVTGHSAAEFEAESVSYMVCVRKEIDSPSHKYLSGYLDSHDQVPEISLEYIMKATRLIESMGRETLQPRAAISARK